MIREPIKQKIKFSIIVLLIVIAIFVAVFTVMKYQVEGEKTVPFNIGKVIVISSASTTDENNEEQNSEGENYIWNEKVVQTNDLYIYLDKNDAYKKDRVIKSVKIENIQILENVKLGKIQVYMPNSVEGSVYKYSDEYLVNSALTYTGAAVDNKKTLEIGNQGGCICISFANMGLGNYKSNDDEVIEQGAAILQKMNISNEDLKFKISFDLTIEVDDITYKTNMILDLPIDELVGQKETHKEITDFKDVIFKRL